MSSEAESCAEDVESRDVAEWTESGREAKLELGRLLGPLDSSDLVLHPSKAFGLQVGREKAEDTPARNRRGVDQLTTQLGQGGSGRSDRYALGVRDGVR